jgi:hypothetical protein
MKMDLGKTPGHATIAIISLLIFFLGFSFRFQRTIMETISSLILMIFLTVAISYRNRTPVGGFVIGLFTSLSFLLGDIISLCVLNITIATNPQNLSLAFLIEYLSNYGLGLLSGIIAIASVGFFFGLLGYVFQNISLKEPTTKPLLFRDYWSSVHLLGKSERREYNDLDRKFGTWRFQKRSWWKNILEKITEAKPDLIFSLNRKKHKKDEFRRGRLFDLSSGQLLGDNFIDPSDLISKYRPSILKVAETSLNPKGVRRLAIERLIDRFLAWFIPSRTIWIFYLSLSALLIFLVNYHYTTDLAASILFPGAEVQAVLAAVITSVGTLFFVWRWRKISRKLFEKRPDERILVFFIYAILAILYGFWFGVIIKPPGFLENWLYSWLLWSISFSILSLLLGVGYLLIHRESEVVNTYLYDNRKEIPEGNRISPFKDPQDEPFWIKKEKTQIFWVLRFMYFWRYEVTLIPHSDWERIEIWIDAQDGAIKWVVSDYHYRELWYKIKDAMSKLYISFFLNFHTPVPIVNKSEAKLISEIFNQKNTDLLKIMLTGKTAGLLENIREELKRNKDFWTKLHPGDWIKNYGLPKIAANFCSMLPWNYWRYSKGLEKVEQYLGIPSTKPEDQPQSQP